MSQFNFDGHPEIPTVPLPQGAHDIQTAIDGDGATITYATAQGAADLVYFFAAPGDGWQGEFMATNGVVEYSNPDGTFTSDGAYYQDARGETGGDLGNGTPVSEGDLVLPDFSQSAASATVDYAGALSAAIMSLSAADHLLTA